MDNKVVMAVTAVVGIGLGFAGGYFVGSIVTKKKCDALINQLNDEVNDYANKVFLKNASKEMHDAVKHDYTDYYNSLDEKEKKLFDQAPDKEAYIHAKEMLKKSEELTKKYWEKSFEVEGTDRHVNEDDTLENDEQYERRIREEKGIDPDDDSDEALAMIEEGSDKEGVELLREVRNLPPYIIDQDDYEDSQFSMFSKQQYTCFGDGVVIDENDEIVADPNGLLGMDNLIEFEDGKHDVIFIRNEDLSADFEVVYKEMSYGEFMGAVDE